MASNFFERQDAARRNTTWLVGMFLLAVVGIVVSTTLIVAIALSQFRAYQPQISGNGMTGESSASRFPWEIPLFAGGAAFLLVGGGTGYKVSQLRSGGGRSVAEHLGGRLLSPDTKDFQQRKLLNVVEEMSIASGVPVPPVYLLDEPGINAFAAGYSPSDAVLGVTRGAVDTLSRDELQGVMAHEFSHLLNGDMRMNIRLIGILHGILLLGLLGRLLLHSAASSGRGRDRGQGAAVLLAASVALIVLGFVGSLMGGLIKAAVSRQREYLADASAVQFTRNPDGIAGALKRIGGSASGSKVESGSAAEVSHMFFAQGVWEGFTNAMATHPPLEKRIRAIDPHWDGKFPAGAAPTSSAPTAAGAAGFAGSQTASPSPVAAAAPATPVATNTVQLATVDQAANRIGEFGEQHRQYAAELIASLPEDIKSSAREPFGARAVVFALLIDKERDVRERQIAALNKSADKATLAAMQKIAPRVNRLDARVRLPLLDLTMPALRTMSPGQYETFDGLLNALIAADNRMSLFEWTLGRMLERHLASEFRDRRRVRISYYNLGKLGEPISLLLSTLAHVGHSGDEAQLAFAVGAKRLPQIPLQFVAREECSLNALEKALDTLASVVEKHRVGLVDVCADVICADGEVTVAESELLRGIADLLDCPMPPLLPGQNIEASAEFVSHRRD